MYINVWYGKHLFTSHNPPPAADLRRWRAASPSRRRLLVLPDPTFIVSLTDEMRDIKFCRIMGWNLWFIRSFGGGGGAFPISLDYIRAGAGCTVMTGTSASLLVTTLSLCVLNLDDCWLMMSCSFSSGLRISRNNPPAFRTGRRQSALFFFLPLSGVLLKIQQNIRWKWQGSSLNTIGLNPWITSHICPEVYCVLATSQFFFFFFHGLFLC